MKALRWIALAPALLLLIAVAQAQVYINGQAPASTTSATAKPVGTNTPVLTISPNADRRCSWTMNWSEAGNLSCLPVGTATTASGTTVTATNGFLLTSTKAPWSSDGLTDDPRLGWQCVSTSGTLNISTEEIYHCANQKIGN